MSTTTNVTNFAKLCGFALGLLLPVLPACGSDSDKTPAATDTTTATGESSTTESTISDSTIGGSTSSAPQTGPSNTLVEVEPPVDPVGTVTTGTLVFDDVERTYRLYVPAELPAGPVPLFIGLHGGGGWAEQFASTTDIENLAESNGFLVVHPEGVKISGGGSGVWNGGICCGIAAREEVDDVGYINAVIDKLSAEHAVDPRRTYAFGHSNGGIMSYRLACELADRIVGIGVVAGTLGVDTCSPTQPVSVLHVHGTDDENLPITGGVGPRSNAGVSFPSPLEGFAALADLNGCPEAVESTDGDVRTARQEPCDRGSVATFVTIETANHAWPAGTPRRTPEAGEGYAGYDATSELVAFLLSHPRP